MYESPGLTSEHKYLKEIRKGKQPNNTQRNHTIAR